MTTRQQQRILDAFENERTVEIIPAKREFTDVKTTKLRVAAYCRVSTDQDEQLSSYENQVNYYRDFISKHEDYELVDIYADEGISATNTKKRDAFNRLI